MCVNNIHTIASYTEMEVKRLVGKQSKAILHYINLCKA
jgi:hypothetical protein